MEFKDKLKKLRTEKGVTQEKLANIVLVSRSTVAKWENGLSLPNEQSLDLLAEYFAIDKSELLSDKNVENAFVAKNIKISQISKLLICITALCVVLLCSFCLFLVFGLKGCGSDEAKIYGITAGVGTEQIDPFVYGNSLGDNETITENDYILQVGQNYLFCVGFIQYGGSKVRSMKAEEISLKYDTEVLEITSPDENKGLDVYYNLTCKKSVAYTAIIVEFDDAYSTNEYSTTVIISAK